MKELCKAMSEAFPEIRKACFDKKNPHFGSPYASLSSVIDAIKPALQSRGLWFVQTIHNTPGFASVETIIMHSSGEALSCGITAVPYTKNDAQGYGSALTYSKRYSLSSAFGVVADDDDDGNEASPPPQSQTAKKAPTPQPDFTPPLSSQEIKLLAKKAAARLSSEDYLIDEGDMEKYLTHWQEKGPLQPAFEELLENKKESVLSSFQRWLSGVSPKAA